MRRADFYYDLPRDLVAQHPPAHRRDARLLHLDGVTGAVQDSHFEALPDFLNPGDLLVFNRSRVIPARVFGRKPGGGHLEMLVERIVGTTQARVHLRASKPPRIGMVLTLDGDTPVRISGREGDLWVVEFDTPVQDYLERHGHIPLPPYISRADEAADRSRYQTIYADRPGAVAAPTAGLHFDDEMLLQLRDREVDLSYLTLHVGAGTFQPVRAERLDEHVMHAERYVVDATTCAAIAATRARGGRVIAVGTTSVRSLESAADEQGRVQPADTETRLFIRPGFGFRVVDAMITNFHLPESTLLMLVSAFAGHTNIMNAYAHAVHSRYRFFSYGDAMFITRGKANDAV